jgi:hypothetical protein
LRAGILGVYAKSNRARICRGDVSAELSRADQRERRRAVDISTRAGARSSLRRALV